MTRNHSTHIRKWVSVLDPAVESLVKPTLRAAFRENRLQQDARLRAYKSSLITDTVLRMPAFQDADVVALYASVDDEVHTDSLITESLAAGKTVVVPRVESKTLVWYKLASLDDLTQTSRFGIREPRVQPLEARPAESIDFFLVPGVVFDRLGGRIGYGGGYYDRVLESARPDAAAFGLAYEQQMIPVLPTETHDQMLTGVITEETVYEPAISTRVTRTEDETRHLAAALVRAGLMKGGVIGLYADLGVGKTVFVDGLARALECREETASPTFVYCREYQGHQTLYHIDGYRLDGVVATDEPFWNELLEMEGLVAVEWAERLVSFLPGGTLHCIGTLLEDDARQWTLITTLASQKELHTHVDSGD